MFVAVKYDSDAQHLMPSLITLFLLIDMPSLSGVSDMDYPLQGPSLLSVPNLPELSAVRRVPLPPELVEQFSRILLVIQLNLKMFSVNI